MAILLFGATGMLGRAISSEAKRRGRDLVGAARSGTDRVVDLAVEDAGVALIAALRPELVVNAAAIVDLDACERDPCGAYAVNARAVALMAAACRALRVPLVQISTDHFFTGGGDRRHTETDPMTLVNEYARTKFAAESFASLAPRTLVVRTNVTGLRGEPGRLTVAEWALDALVRRAPLRLFDDYHSSTIDTIGFARALFDLIDTGTTGVVNLAARTVASKARFVRTLAGALGIALDWDERASVRELATPRAESVGLDVAKAERILGYALPDTETVCRNLVLQWKEQRCAMQPAS
ncbi:MAG TPA: sugar nucleotide-binding protein [Stellaceae bacterium]|nr:sugar nucleotide-binding protein [Stellaceae bacterium]